MSSSKKIVVNAVAASSSGALTILYSFVNEINANDVEFIIFTSIDINIQKENIEIINVGKKRFVRRIIWDLFVLSYYLRSKKITPKISFSLQNIGFRTSYNEKQIIFFHNPFMLYDKYWNPLRRSEVLFWFYKNIYKYIFLISLKEESVVVVQSSWAKGRLIKLGIQNDKIKIIKGIDEFNIILNMPSPPVSKHKIKLLFPATPFKYKNHLFLFDLIYFIKLNYPLLFNKIELSLTLTISDLKKIGLLKKYLLVQDRINLLGYVDSYVMEQLYSESDFLIFPSEIETLGLPLLEASKVGSKILCIDMEYSRELLNGYDKVVFLKLGEYDDWAQNILNFTPIISNVLPEYRADFVSFQELGSYLASL